MWYKYEIPLFFIFIMTEKSFERDFSTGLFSQSNDDQSASSTHKVDFAERWSVWKTLCFRSAGFPASLIEGIVCDKAAKAVDRLLDCENAYIEKKKNALQICIDNIKVSSAAERKAWRRLEKLLKQERIPAPPEKAPEFAKILTELSCTLNESLLAKKTARNIFQESEIITTKFLQGIARNSKFREAIIWQNHEVLHNAINSYLQMNIADRSRVKRRRELIIASYLQRYCLKNDSIGFFGPVGWCEIKKDLKLLQFNHGKELVRERKVFFEYWAIGSLARSMSRDPEMFEWLTPRLHPFYHMEKSLLIDLSGRSQPLSQENVKLLGCCDGIKSIRNIALDLSTGHSPLFASVKQVLRRLKRLLKNNVIVADLNIPVAPFPEKILRNRLAQISDISLRKRMTAQVEEVVSAFEAVKSAAGNEAALDKAMSQLEECFVNHTGKKHTRAEGKTYAGRTLVYEDCLRDVDMSIGPDFLAGFSQSLAPLLKSARWYSYNVGLNFQKKFMEIYRQYAHQLNTEVIPLGLMFKQLRKARFAVVDSVVKDFKERWASVLLNEPSQKQVEFSSAFLRERVDDIFDAPAPGWPSARFISPDIMIAAQDAAAIEQGNYTVILGEIHIGNTINQRTFLPFVSSQEEVFKNYRYDQPFQKFVSVFHEDQWCTRTIVDADLPHDLEIALHATPSWRGQNQVFPISALVVIQNGDGMHVQTRDGKHKFNLADFFHFFLRHYSNVSFGLLPAVAHIPRIVTSTFILHREAWRFSVKDLYFCKEKSSFARFIEVTRWAQKAGLPLQFFVRFESEAKPVYINLKSQVLVDLLVKGIRKQFKDDPDSGILFTEMLPATDELWFTDSTGEKYTCELRLVAVDQCQWREIPWRKIK